MNVFNPLININEFNDISNINTYVDNSSDDHLFNESLDFLTRLNEDYTIANKEFYLDIMKSGNNTELIREAYEDFFKKMDDNIDKFVKHIRRTAKDAADKLSRNMKNRYIFQDKGKLKLFTDDDSFTIDGYIFTFNDNIPVTNAFEKLNLINLDGSVNVGNLFVSDNIKKNINVSYNELLTKLDKGYYDTFRGLVLNSTKPISNSEFTKECFKVYRNGESDTRSILINKNDIDEALERNNDKKKLADNISSIVTTVDKLEKEYKDISKDINRMIHNPDNKYNNIIPAEAEDSLNLYAKFLCNNINEMCNIHTIAFVQKVHALNNQYDQDVKILSKAMSIVDSKTIHESAGVESEGHLWII